MGCSGKNHPIIIKHFHPLNLEIRLIIVVIVFFSTAWLRTDSKGYVIFKNVQLLQWLQI